MIIMVSLITERSHRSHRGVWREPHTLLLWFITKDSLVLCSVVRKLYQDELLNVRMDFMSER